MKIKKIALLDDEPRQNDGLDFEKMERESFIDVTKPLAPQPVAISIGETYWNGNPIPIPLGSYGDYSCIVGLSKSKKTFFKSGVAAAYQGGNATNFFSNMKGHDFEGKYVIDIDTEQSKWHSKMVFKRVTDMVGTVSPLYKSYALRSYSPDQRVAFIDWLVYRSPFKGKIGLILIDGFADLLYDFNDIEQSQKLQTKILKWAEDSGCHITGVLHRNFGTAKPVGHIGSAILKKAETVVFLERSEANKSETEVTCEYSRNKPFEKFSFTVGSDWLPKEVTLYNTLDEEELKNDGLAF